MTENEKIVKDEIEAIECLKNNKPTSGYQMLQEAIDMAIKALEEVQQYRAIGTPEVCRKAVEICKAMIERGIELEDVENYIALEDELVKKGYTIGELMQTREKESAKKTIKRRHGHYCPKCNNYFAGIDWKNKYCGSCGQHLDWKDEE